MPKIDIAGLKIDSITKQDLLTALLSRMTVNQKAWVTTPYSEFLHAALKDNGWLEILNKVDFAVPDGIGIFWAKRFLDLPFTAKNYWLKILQAYWQATYSMLAILFYPRWIRSALAEKIPGSELIWDIARLAAENNLSIYLLGGFGDTPKIVAEKLATYYPLLTTHYNNKNPNDVSVIEDINNARPDILLIAYGPIRQEQWIFENRDKLSSVKLFLGLGGTFDYIAGKRIKPPRRIRKTGLEWLYRLFTQPYRIKRIYNATWGLMNLLVHYKVFMACPMRKNAAAIIINKNNQVFIGKKPGTGIDIISNHDKKKWKNYWQFPQGGIEEGENIVEATKREIQEETGMAQVEFLKISGQTHAYVWNNALRKFWRNRDYRFRGQTQQVLYFKFTGDNNVIKLPPKEEFMDYKWVSIDELDKAVHPERLALAKIVQDDLKDWA